MPKGKRNPNRAVLFVWDGDVMIPLPRFKRMCDQLFAVHEEYPLIVLENRSMASHRHYFAAVAEAWENLSEEHTHDGQGNVRFPTSEHLRAWALVEAGYATETKYVMDTPKDAKQLAIMLRKKEPLAIIRVRGNVVQEFIPESQSTGSMKKQAFEDSKAAVLAIVAPMARTTPAQLHREAEQQTGRKRA